jgi:carbon monoxide dehydrogenase subunit G
VKLDQSFEVNAPLQAVWEALVDVERVAPCLPGAEITEGGDDGQYKGTFTVKLGPTTAAYRGTLHMESVDEASHTAVMRANGTDKRGQGGAKAQITSVVTEGEGGATKVDVSTDFTITGRLARFGRGGMIQDVSNRLLREFADCLRASLEPAPAPAAGEPAAPAPASPPAAKPVSGLRLFFGALWDRLRRLFGGRG